MDGPAIEIEHLRKRYGRFEALAGILLEVPRGCVFGLLGPNGAGKSTLVKSLLTILRPTECKGRMLGHPIGHRRTLAKTGYLPEHARFPEYLSGREIIGYSAALAGVPRSVANERAGRLLERVDMAKWGSRPLATYSKGMRQRIGLAQALVNDPELIFLDEPTDGVDPAGRIEIRNLVLELREEGRTVFLNSHLLAEVEQMADEVAILSGGRVLERGNVADLTRRGRRYEIRTQGPVPLDLRQKFEAGGLTVRGDLVVVDSGDAAPVQPLIDALRAAGTVIREIREAKLSLEDLFLQTVQSGKEARP